MIEEESAGQARRWDPDKCPVCGKRVSDMDGIDGMEGTPGKDDAQRWHRTHHQVLTLATEWLNEMHRRTSMAGESEERITLEEWWDWDDPPTMLFDVDVEGNDLRTMQLLGTPFYDEGGPALITAIFEADEVYEQVSGRTVQLGWSLQCLVYGFDTRYSLIYEDGKLVYREIGA
jgi:hypothetical protein